MLRQIFKRNQKSNLFYTDFQFKKYVISQRQRNTFLAEFSKYTSAIFMVFDCENVISGV